MTALVVVLRRLRAEEMLGEDEMLAGKKGWTDARQPEETAILVHAVKLFVSQEE